MLVIKQKRSRHTALSRIIVSVAILLVGGGLYLLSIISAPAIAPIIATKPIEVKTLPAPVEKKNRLVIPKIGVNIDYAPGEESLDRGAQWRYPERGNPAVGGNFIIAAHRFSIQPTPTSTIEKSPFYHIDKLALGDKVIIDYLGVRYGYEIDRIFEVEPTQTEVEESSDTAKLTLYTCELSGAQGKRAVLTAKPLGKVAL
ncbi:sortase [Candidatus Saccharibacteria bacterium oral taxon 955]|nr:sortase [Candidatus Saccharibacteria bacterium oral taxon 955]QJU06128.1 sortase [Candidatus Saccharibacteria bacterium oral taxon 955]